jgi:hypothetical protein
VRASVPRARTDYVAAVSPGESRLYIHIRGDFCRTTADPGRGDRASGYAIFTVATLNLSASDPAAVARLGLSTPQLWAHRRGLLVDGLFDSPAIASLVIGVNHRRWHGERAR